MSENTVINYVKKELGPSPTPQAYLELGKRIQSHPHRTPFPGEQANEIALYCFRMAVISTIAAHAQNLLGSLSLYSEETPPSPPTKSPKPALTPEQQQQRQHQRENEAARLREKYIKLSIALAGAGSIIFAFVLGFIG